MDKCVAPDWLMCWTMDLEVWFRNLTASFFFLLLGQTLKSCGASLLSWTSEKVDKLQGGLTCNGLSSWKSNALLHSVSRETGINFSSGSLTLWGFGNQYSPPFTLYWRQLILLPFPLKTMWYLQKIIRPPSPSDRSPKVSFHLTEKDWGASQLYCPCWVSRGCWGSLSTGVKSLRICSSYSTRPRYARFYGSTVADIDQVCLIRVPFNSYRVWCFVSSMASWMTRYFPTLLVQLWCKFDAEYRILLYSLWRPSELMAYAVKPRHSEL